MTTAMKPEQHNRLGNRGFLDQRPECSPEVLQQPEIVGQVGNPTLEAIRRLGWRALDRVCDLIMVIRLSIHGRIYGPEPPTAADLKREADYERLVRLFLVIGGAIEPIKPCRGEDETAI
jgi:hypothetical protein